MHDICNDIVLINDPREGVNRKFEQLRDTLMAKGFKLSRSKTQYLKSPFNDDEMAIRVVTIPRVEKLRYLQLIIQDGILMKTLTTN